MKTERGFSLIELLVVIGIIATLSTIGVISYTNSLKSARDAKRISDLRDIATYLQLYYKQNSRYPDSANECGGWEKGSSISDDGFNELSTQLTAAGVLDRPLPVEKNLTGCTYKYRRCSPDGVSTYAILYADLETDSGEGDVRPTISGGSCWTTEANPGTAQDKKDWAIFLLE